MQSKKPFNRVLLTGAAGGLGKALRDKVAELANYVRLSDIVPLGELESHEEFILADLSDHKSVLRIVQNVDLIIHLGGLSLDAPFQHILEANIRGTFHIYEAARIQGTTRIIFASSNHVIGFYKQDQFIDTLVERRPDCYYGLSKSFGEDLASYYFDRFNIETLSIRIGSSFPTATNKRALSTWLHFDDLFQLITKGATYKNLGHLVVYGVSDNQDIWWNNQAAEKIGYKPQHSSEQFRTEIEKLPALPANDPSVIYQGGPFTQQGPYEIPFSSRQHLQGCELLVDAQNATGESPVWIPHEQSLYWVDISGCKIHRWEMATQIHQSWDTHEEIGSIARATDGSWLAAQVNGIYRLELKETGQIDRKELALVQHAQDNMRFNDGRCDPAGRFWVGSMVRTMPSDSSAGVLYRYDSKHGLVPMLKDFKVPNGLAFSPDGKTMYVSDSHPDVQLIWAFDYDISTGTPSNRRIFIDMNQFPGRPDGAAVDLDGYYWICAIDAGLIHRFSPDGRLDRSLSVPVQKPTMLAFGGALMETLFITSIRPQDSKQLATQPWAGGVFSMGSGSKGQIEPWFLSTLS